MYVDLQMHKRSMNLNNMMSNNSYTMTGCTAMNNSGHNIGQNSNTCYSNPPQYVLQPTNPQTPFQISPMPLCHSEVTMDKLESMAKRLGNIDNIE